MKKATESAGPFSGWRLQSKWGLQSVFLAAKPKDGKGGISMQFY